MMKLSKFKLSIYSKWFLFTNEPFVVITNDDMPLFVSSIPAIMDLDAAQELDRKKQM